MRHEFNFACVLAALCLLAAFPVNAMSPATVELATNQVAWTPAAQFGEAALTVRGPDGEVESYRFDSDQRIVYSLLADEGVRDGLYVWELTLSPVGERARADRGVDQVQKLTPLPSNEAVQSGSFRVIRGTVLMAERSTEKSFIEQSPKTGKNDQDNPTRDQVINDDSIIIGSQCVGMDCTNGESFGFDTIRLKENNLRIKFQDTSNSGSFPSTDWQLTANDSTNGGQNRFSIEDITAGRIPFTVEGSAPSNSLYVDDGGRIGVGTATPVVEMHVKDGDSPALRLEQDGSSGFTPQTWDVAGNETNFFVRDATNGSRIPFKIRPSAPTNSLYVNTDGNVGVGTASPSARLDVVGDAEVNGNLFLEDITMQNANLADKWFIRHQQDNSTFVIDAISEGASPRELPLVLTATGNLTIAGSLSQSSDVNAKTNIRTIDHNSLLKGVAALPIYQWQYRQDTSGATHLGPMAQDFFAEFGLGVDERHISTLDTGGVALAAIQALLTEVEDKAREIQELERHNQDLEERLLKIEERLATLE